MKNFSISHIYSEPGVYFRVSHKVTRLIRERVRELISTKTSFGHEVDNIVFTISTKKECKTLSVYGPNESDNETVWTIWLPYMKWSCLDEELSYYLIQLSIACCQVLEKLGIKESDIVGLFRKIEEMVIGNEEYEFHDPLIPMPDLKKLGIDIEKFQ